MRWKSLRSNRSLTATSNDKRTAKEKRPGANRCCSFAIFRKGRIERRVCERCEEVLLSAMMDGRELSVMLEDFSSSHRPIYKAIVSQTRKRRNFLSVTNVLRESGDLEKVGGAARITEIGLLPHDPVFALRQSH